MFIYFTLTMRSSYMLPFFKMWNVIDGNLFILIQTIICSKHEFQYGVIGSVFLCAPLIVTCNDCFYILSVKFVLIISKCKHQLVFLNPLLIFKTIMALFSVTIFINIFNSNMNFIKKENKLLYLLQWNNMLQ